MRNNDDFNHHINKLIAFLNNIPHINKGGCGFAAWSIYRFMEVYGDSEPEFVTCYEEPHEVVLNGSAIRNNKFGHINPPTHYFVLYKGQYYDSLGIHNTFSSSISNLYFELKVSKIHTYIAIMCKWGWTKKFDRKHVFDIKDYLINNYGIVMFEDDFVESLDFDKTFKLMCDI